MSEHVGNTVRLGSTTYVFTAALIALVAVCFLPGDAAGTHYLYHATGKAAAKQIAKNGFKTSKSNAKSRFGKKYGYFSQQKSTALAEKGKGSALVRVKTSKQLERETLDLRKPTKDKLRSYVGKIDLRGTVKNGVPGPKIGHKIGRRADHEGKAIMYRSTKTGGSNIAVPEKMMKKHPRAISQIKVMDSQHHH